MRFVTISFTLVIMALEAMGVEGSLRGVTRVEAEGRDLREALIGVGAEAPIEGERDERDPLIGVGEEAPTEGERDERDPLVGVGEEAPTDGEGDERDPLVGVGEEAPTDGEGDERDPVGVGDEAPTRDDPEDPTEDPEVVCANSDLPISFGTQEITCQELALFRAKKQRNLCQAYEELSTHCPGVCKTAPRCSCFDTRSEFYLNKRNTFHCDNLNGKDPDVIQRKCRKQIIAANCPSLCNPSSCAATSE